MKTTVAVVMVAAAALLACKLGPDVKTTVNCNGSARFGVRCSVSHTSTERLKACWKVRFGCGSSGGRGFDVPACAVVEPQATVTYGISAQTIAAAQLCDDITTTSVVETVVTKP